MNNNEQKWRNNSAMGVYFQKLDVDKVQKKRLLFFFCIFIKIINLSKFNSV